MSICAYSSRRVLDCILGLQQSSEQREVMSKSGAGRNGGGVGRADGWGPGSSMLPARTGNGQTQSWKRLRRPSTVVEVVSRQTAGRSVSHACTLLLPRWTCICTLLLRRQRTASGAGWLNRLMSGCGPGARSIRGHPVRAYGAPKSGSWGRGRQQTQVEQGCQVLCSRDPRPNQ